MTDCCVPISKLADCISRTKEEIAKSGFIAPIVGHVGDGNFHLVILFASNVENEFRSASPLAESVCEISLEMGGTISGEHGIGIGKKKYMNAEHGAAYDLMNALKKNIDPKSIMNPGKLVS